MGIGTDRKVLVQDYAELKRADLLDMNSWAPQNCLQSNPHVGYYDHRNSRAAWKGA